MDLIGSITTFDNCKFKMCIETSKQCSPDVDREHFVETLERHMRELARMLSFEVLEQHISHLVEMRDTWWIDTEGS